MKTPLKERNKKAQSISFRRFLKGNCDSWNIRVYVSLNYLELRNWIESKWISGMDWSNYGSVWVIDHIVPLRMFDLFDEEDLMLVWNYQNLR